MKNILVILMPMMLLVLVGCNNEEAEPATENDKLGSETVIDEPNEEVEESDLIESSIVRKR